MKTRKLEDRDAEAISAAFTKLGWNKPAPQYRRYLSEQELGERDVLVVLVDDEFAGYLTVKWRAEYEPFALRDIPEIQDLNVLPHLRRRGIATRLMDEAEALISERSAAVGIGVGMTSDYGAAQRMYVKRGYVPDGNGLMASGKPVEYGKPAVVDDDLVLYFMKPVGPETHAVWYDVHTGSGGFRR